MKKLNPKIAIIALTIVALALTSTTIAALTVNKSLQSTGTIVTTPNINVYSDSACTQSINSFDWGSIDAGGSATKTIYVKNTGTGTINLELTVDDWTPTAAGSYINITWDADGTQLSAGQSTTATLTITVESTITGVTTFSNSIIISGSS